MSDDLRVTHIVCDEARAFDARHPELAGPARSTGMLAWGLLRALLLCDICGPGVYRVPQDDGWHTLVCPQCCGVWAYTPQAEATAPKPRQRRRKGRGG